MTSLSIKPYPIEPIAEHLLPDQGLADALLASIDEYRDQLRGRRIWLACSGGRDSLALAALCLQLYRQGRLPFLPQLLHVDHGWQADSKYWAAHVAKWAQAQQLPCQVLQVTVQGTDEQAARQARYQAMLSHINQQDVLLLAHHADDQAETVLMRLIQGAGVKGLSGMQPWRVQVRGAQHHILWRPWLSVRRTKITAYAERLQLPYIDDPTNDSGDNVRSGLRIAVLPVLAGYNSNAIENIARSAQLLSEAQAIVSEQAAQDLQQSAIDQLRFGSAQQVLDIDALSNLPIYRQRQLLHFWLSQDEPLPPSKQLVDEVLTLTQRDDHDHQTQLDWHARKQSYSIFRYRQQLYRLSHGLLNWLTLPIDEQTQLLADFTLSADKELIINVRKSVDYHWQFTLALDDVLPFIDSNEHNSDNQKLTLNVAALSRRQRIHTKLANRPQAGKKLYQTLGIPVWLRDSLVVISLKLADSNYEYPLLLLSPFESWVLVNDSSKENTAMIRGDNWFNNKLRVHK